jgi:hypothetical protein
MEARRLERQQDSTWAMQSQPSEVAVNASALRSKLLTKPWESLLELGRDELPREVPDLRPQVPNLPETLLVRIRREGLAWPRYEYYGLVAVETPVEEPEEPPPPPEPPEPEPEPLPTEPEPPLDQGPVQAPPPTPPAEG